MFIATQLGLKDQEGKAEYEVRSITERLLEGTRVRAISERDAIDTHMANLMNILVVE